MSGLKLNGDLFTSPNRGQWDLKDTRTRVPWSGFALLVDQVAHDSFRVAWKDAMASVIQAAAFPVWKVGYRLSDRKDDMLKPSGVSVVPLADLMLAFEGGLLKDSVFRPSSAVKAAPAK